jgi:hypothetical protein
VTKQKRTSLDWEAIERDWRTGEFTLRELADKHKTDAATISRRQKRDRTADPNRWQKDLSGVVRQATSAQLINTLVNEKIKEGQQEVNDVVLAAAQANTTVILRHRADIGTLRTLAMDMAHELALVTHSQEEVKRLQQVLAGGDIDPDELDAARRSLDDLLRLHNRVTSAQRLADTLTKLQTMERRAFNLDDEGSSAGGAGAGRELSDVERAARMAAILDRARARKAQANAEADPA